MIHSSFGHGFALTADHAPWIVRICNISLILLIETILTNDVNCNHSGVIIKFVVNCIELFVFGLIINGVMKISWKCSPICARRAFECLPIFANFCQFLRTEIRDVDCVCLRWTSNWFVIQSNQTAIGQNPVLWKNTARGQWILRSYTNNRYAHKTCSPSSSSSSPKR